MHACVQVFDYPATEPEEEGEEIDSTGYLDTPGQRNRDKDRAATAKAAAKRRTLLRLATELAVYTTVKHPCVVQVHCQFTNVVLLPPGHGGNAQYRLLADGDPALSVQDAGDGGGECLRGPCCSVV